MKSFAIFTGKHLLWSFFSIKLQAWRSVNLLKRDPNTGVFLWILPNFSEQLFFTEHLWLLLLFDSSSQQFPIYAAKFKNFIWFILINRSRSLLDLYLWIQKSIQNPVDGKLSGQYNPVYCSNGGKGLQLTVFISYSVSIS